MCFIVLNFYIKFLNNLLFIYKNIIMFQTKNYYLRQLNNNQCITSFNYDINQIINNFIRYNKIKCNYKFHNNYNIESMDLYDHGLWLDDDMYNICQIKKYQFVIPGFLPIFKYIFVFNSIYICCILIIMKINLIIACCLYI